MGQGKIFRKNDILKAINSGQPLEIDFPIINESIQNALHFTIDSLLTKYKKLDLREVLYSSLKELVINGVKANMKHYFFKEANINIKSRKSLMEGYKLLREKLNVKELAKFEVIAKENDLEIHVTMLHSKQRIILLVENNTPLSKYEDERIRNKFDNALKYDSLADFFIEAGDDFEGSGLGITMIVLMLKGRGIDPHAFTIDTQDEQSTVAKIEFPLKAGVSLIRKAQ